MSLSKVLDNYSKEKEKHGTFGGIIKGTINTFVEHPKQLLLIAMILIVLVALVTCIVAVVINIFAWVFDVTAMEVFPYYMAIVILKPMFGTFWRMLVLFVLKNK